MATKLDKTIKRELELEGKLYTVAISPEGVKITPKGARKGQEISWSSLVSGEADLRRDPFTMHPCVLVPPRLSSESIPARYHPGPSLASARLECLLQVAQWMH